MESIGSSNGTGTCARQRHALERWSAGTATWVEQGAGHRNPKEQSLHCSRTLCNRMMKLDRDGKVSVFREAAPGEGSPAWRRDAGRLVSGLQAVAAPGHRTGKDGIISVADRPQGRRQAPRRRQAICIGNKRHATSRYSRPGDLPELDKEGQNTSIRRQADRIIDSLTRPNGIRVVTRDRKQRPCATQGTPQEAWPP